MKRMWLVGWLLLLTTVLAWAAAPPALINYQGVLRDANDEALTGTWDMTFCFFDAEQAGGEILCDAHTGPDAIDVDGGLFVAALGGGTVSDGSGAGTYTSLDQVFRDFDAVWLEIRISGETLAPRTRVLSAAYALNATQLGGMNAGDFLDTSATEQSKTGKLTLGALDINGSLRLVDEFFATIWFADSGDPQAERLSWDRADSVFEATAGMQLDGPLIAGNTANLPLGYSAFGTSGSPAGADFDSPGDVYVQENLEVDGDAYFSGVLYIDNDGPDGDQRLRFFNDGSVSEELKWDEAAERFEFSDALAIAGSLRVGQTQGSPEVFSHLGNLGDVPDSDDMNGTQDLYIEGDVEIEDTLYLDRTLVMLDYGPDADGDGVAGDDVDQWIFFYDNAVMDDEWLRWRDDLPGAGGGSSDRFEFSDSLHVYGNLTALTKNFVQNHPQREDLEIVYTSLEGDEAAVFTRGYGRLVDGEARVPLGATFAMVAHPEIGLGAQLTPRGEWAELYVASLTPEELVVRARPGSSSDTAFDWIVFGLRLGYEDSPVIRPRRSDSPLPMQNAWDEIYRLVPEARELSAATRYRTMAGAEIGNVTLDAAGPSALALRQAIGEADPEEPQVARPTRIREEESEERSRATRPNATVSAAVSEAPTGRIDQSAAPVTIGARHSSERVRAQSFRAIRPGVAMLYDAGEAIEAGDVVVLDPLQPGTVRRAERGEDRAVLGIAGDDAGLVLVDEADDERATGRVAVALSGVVPCRVDAAWGAIAPGDLLVSSPTPGHAMRSSDPLPGTVIGKALEPLAEGNGTILVLVFQR